MKAAWLGATIAVFLALGLLSPVAVDAKTGAPGTWSKAGSLLQRRVGHTATLLPNGLVLVAGGANAQVEATWSSELFDPKIERWLPAASMNTARVRHAATLLSNGKVLVTGGQTGLDTYPIDDLSSAEIYDPAIGNWTRAASMHVPRAGHDAIRLLDGRVLIVGGFVRFPSGAPPPEPELEPAEIYDPVRDTWALGGAGLPLRTQQAATLMPNGSVLVTGGQSNDGEATREAELFDPVRNRWQPTTWPMATARYGHTSTLLPDGKVLLVGGYSTEPQTVGGFVYPNPQLLTTSETFDLRGNTGVRVGYSMIPRLEHTATLLRNGLVLVVGSAYASDADSQLFDPGNTADWVSTGLRMDRYLHSATLLADGRVLIAGGYGVGSATTAWIYSPMAGMSAPSGYAPVLLTAGVLLTVLIAFAFSVASGRFLRRRRATFREDDSRWIDS